MARQKQTGRDFYAQFLTGVKKEYYQKYGELPSRYDWLGAKEEQILTEALEKGVTWQELLGIKEPTHKVLK